MFLLITLVVISTLIGALGGSIAVETMGPINGATVGIMFGSFIWYILGTIDRIQHERRLDSFFYGSDLITPNDMDLT